MRYLIVANGPFLTRDILIEASKKADVLVSLDGAVSKLVKLGIMPDVILGDFDSIELGSPWEINLNPGLIQKETINPSAHVNKYNILVVHTPDQNATDLAKAIKFCDHDYSEIIYNQLIKKKFIPASEIDILCAVDGRPDHHFGTLGVLSNYFRSERPIRVHSQAYTLQYVENQVVTIPAQTKEKHQIAIMGMPRGSFISNGLSWNGQAQEPENVDAGPEGYKVFLGHDSTCNLLNADGLPASIKVLGQVVIMQPGIYPSQKQYENTSEEIECCILRDRLSQLDCRLIEMQEREWFELKRKLRAFKQKANIKKYTAEKLNEEALPHGKKVRQIATSANQAFRLFSVSKEKHAQIQALKALEMNKINALSEEELSEMKKELGYH